MNLRVLSRLSIATLIALMALGTVTAVHVQNALAYTAPSIVQSASSNNMNNTTATMSVTLPTSIGPGHEMAVLWGWGGGNKWYISSMTDSLGGLFYRANGTEAYIDPGDTAIWPLGHGSQEFGSVDGLNDDAGAAYDILGDAASNGSDTITIDLVEQNCPCNSSWLQTSLNVFEFDNHSGEHNVLGSGFEYLSENGGGGTSHVTANPTNIDGDGINYTLDTTHNDLDLAIYIDGGADKTVSVPTGENMIATNSPTTNIGIGVASGSAVSAFEFDTSGNAGYSVVDAISISGS